MSSIKNILTFDIEDWFHANYDHIDSDSFRGSSSNFRRNMDELLELCARTHSHATFFTLGCIGEDYPDVVKKIVEQGHDLASHGYSHQLAYKQTKAEFKQDVQKSIDILSNLVGKKILGYRAPSWSIVEKNYGYLEVLEELNFKYDASVFPIKTFLYGIPDAPKEIHHPTVNGRELKLYEVPMSVINLLGKQMGYSGGFYFRCFPEFVVKMFIKSANKRGEHSIVYLHPREIDSTEQKLSLPTKEAFIHYHNVKGTKAKLTSILEKFDFISIADKLATIDK